MILIIGASSPFFAFKNFINECLMPNKFKQKAPSEEEAMLKGLLSLLLSQ